MIVAAGENPARSALRARTIGLIVLLAVAAPLFLARLGNVPLLDPDEAKHAQIAREMLADGRWIEPMLNGQPYHHKPSLLYVLIGFCYRAFGVGEFAARAVPAAAGVFTLAMVFWEGSRRRIAQGWLAALLLSATSLFFAVARFTNFDGLLTCVTSAAAIAASRWVVNSARARRGWTLVAALAACAVLVKGPAGAVLLAVPLAMSGRAVLGHAPAANIGRAALIFAVVVGAWFVPATYLHPEYVADFLWVHNVQRFSVDADVFHPEPFWFFLPVLLVTLLPWSLLVPAALVAAWKRDPADRFLAMYAIWVVAFFSMSNGKLATYVLPAYPALAILVARWLDERPSRPAGLSCRGVAFAYLASPVVGYIVLRAEEPGFEGLAWTLVPVALVGSAVLVSRRGPLGRARDAIVAMCCATILTFVVALFGYAPLAAVFSSDQDLVAELSGRGPPPDVVVVHKVRPFSFLFYSGWPLVYKVPEDEYRAALTMPGRVWVLTKDSRLPTFPAVVPSLGLREIARNHRHVVLERIDPPPDP
jgi:4-amino-4-deoxy-L-arabinose transferase-like glycosyltransferase